MTESHRPTATNGFVALRVELARRTKRPSGQFVFWVYFAVVVVLGGLGFWLELTQRQRDWNNAYTSLVTFFPALIGSSCVQMVFETGNRRMQAFAVLSLFFALIAGTGLISAERPASLCVWVTAIVMCVFSLWVWWIANADNTALHDGPTPDAPVGGDPYGPLAGGYGEVEV